jgi:hypothetical protein
MTVTGRPWDELEDTLTIPRLKALTDHWREKPPVGDLVAAYLEFKPPDKIEVATAPASSDDPSGVGFLIQQFPNGLVPADRP